jgi:peptidoglycan/xylan/chitin deacetylase (PgdA/CDA1 family)
LRDLLLSSWNASGSIRNYVKRNWFTIILYHKIDTESFEEHMEFFSRRYSLAHLDSLREHYENGIRLPRDALFITFDDGWRSNYALLPIIDEKAIPVTIFLTTGFMGTNKKPAPITYFHDTAFDDVENLFSVETSRTMLNNDEIKEMSRVVNFQSHGVYHHPSTSLTPDQFRSDLLESKKSIETITGKQVYAFAYPYNRAGEREARIVASCGYIFARAGGRMMNRAVTNPFLLHSIGVETNCPVNKLKKKILKAELKTLFST